MTYTQTLYEADDVAWSDQQVQLLRDCRWDELDLDHIIEEIEDVDGRHRDSLESQIEIYLMHRLNQIYQPDKATRSWDNSIRASLKAIRREIKRRPSLRRHVDECFSDCYENAREDAAEEIGLDLSIFPEQYPIGLKDELVSLL